MSSARAARANPALVHDPRGAAVASAGRAIFVGSIDLKGRAQMSVLLLIVGVLLGGACVAALQRRAGRRPERLREELKAISLDVLQQTGDSLAQRLDTIYGKPL